MIKSNQIVSLKWMDLTNSQSTVLSARLFTSNTSFKVKNCKAVTDGKDERLSSLGNFLNCSSHSIQISECGKEKLKIGENEVY